MADKKLHSAGIFSDMTVDGPEIGTLVVIVDRAKNLPNRKSIGKQDPYCAARLGKFSHKTETDKRGGQTPRWDQELRFTVYDSPDYYKLKVSVFNDDKKTEMISETYIKLDDVIVPGGGKNDKWHNLQFKNKYAGEIRMEMTYYDSRPKPIKLASSKEGLREGTPSNAETGREGASGPRVMKERVKRRPLPVDPVTGERPVQPAEPVAEKYGGGPRAPRQRGAAGAEVPLRQASPQRRGYAAGEADYQQQPQAHPQSQRGYPAAPPEQSYRDQPQPYQESAQPQIPPHSQRGHGPPEHNRQPQQQPNYQEPPYIHNQPPLQQVEYHTPQHARTQSYPVQGQYTQSSMQQPSSSRHHNAPPPLNLQNSRQSLRNQEPASQGGYTQPSASEYGSQQPGVGYNDRRDQYGQAQQSNYVQISTPNRYEDQYSRGQQDEANNHTPQHTYIIPKMDTPPSPTGPPPPPPAHRVLHSINTAASSPGYGYNPPQPVKDQFEHLRQNAHRQSLPTYSSNTPSYTYAPPQQTFAPQPQQASPPKPAFVEPSSCAEESPRLRTQDNRYATQYSSMQPSVEDAPPTPSPFNTPAHYRQASEQVRKPVQQPSYEDVPAPAPLNLGRRPSAVSINDDYQAPPVAQPKPVYPGPVIYQANDIRHNEQYREPPQQMQPAQEYPTQRDEYPQQTYSQESYRSRSPTREPQRWQQQEEEAERPGSSGYMPSLPPTLVAGMDPRLAQEISDRINEETRRQRGQPTVYHQDTYARDAAQRYAESSQQQSYRPTSRGRDTGSYAPSSYQSQPRGSNAYGTTNSRGVSPGPSPMNSYSNTPSHQHTIVRKSVSPAPPPSRGSDSNKERRLSAVPFGPDDYAALNPNAPKAAEAISTVEDTDAKIIMHDGREVDPSDHLPEASWAALPPNLRKSFDNPTSRDTRERPTAVSPAVQARIDRRARERPHSMAGDTFVREFPPPAAGRTRLVKKANRMSAQPSFSAGASPAGGYSSNSDFARGLPRSHTFDVNAERAERYDREREVYGPGGRNGMGMGPPLPAKIPLPHMHSAPAAPPSQQYVSAPGLPQPPVMGMGGVSSGARESNEAAWSLLDEMKSIDLGTGRGRRNRGGN